MWLEYSAVKCVSLFKNLLQLQREFRIFWKGLFFIGASCAYVAEI